MLFLFLTLKKIQQKKTERVVKSGEFSFYMHGWSCIDIYMHAVGVILIYLTNHPSVPLNQKLLAIIYHHVVYLYLLRNNVYKNIVLLSLNLLNVNLITCM